MEAVSTGNSFCLLPVAVAFCFQQFLGNTACRKPADPKDQASLLKAWKQIQEIHHSLRMS